METVDLTWRDKIGIIDLTARVAVSLFLAVAVVSQLVAVVVSH